MRAGTERGVRPAFLSTPGGTGSGCRGIWGSTRLGWRIGGPRYPRLPSAVDEAGEILDVPLQVLLAGGGQLHSRALTLQLEDMYSTIRLVSWRHNNNLVEVQRIVCRQQIVPVAN